MRFYEIQTIKPLKPLSPQEAKLASLRRQKENLSKQIEAERNRQKIARAQQQIYIASK